MSASSAESVPNPYASPQVAIEARVVEEKPEKEKPAFGSLGMIFGGFVLVLVGYLCSNLLLISDLYQVGFGPDGKAVPSPFAMAVSQPWLLWLLYCLTAAAFIAGAVMVGSQNWNPLAFVCYMFCPIVCLVFVVGAPLRMVKKHAFLVSTLYLAVGTCLAGAGIIRLFNLYGQANADFEAVLASMMAEAGLALACGAALKLSLTLEEAATASPAASAPVMSAAAARS